MELFTFIGEKIRELRGARKLSQEQLGREMGVPTNTISRWETATYRPKIEDLDGLARFFGVSILDFFPVREAGKDETMAAFLRTTKKLKHHFADQGIDLSFCDVSNETNYIEIGAEVFAAEMIFPEGDFDALAQQYELKRGQVTANDVVRFKRETRTTLSHKAVVKRFAFLGYANAASFAGVKWKKLEEQIYGVPLYKKLLGRRKR